MDPELTVLTLNAQKMGSDIPFLNIIAVLDRHKPDFLFMTEFPLHPHNGALNHVLRNWRYSLHYHPSNALSQPEVLLETSLPTYLKHPGGG